MGDVFIIVSRRSSLRNFALTVFRAATNKKETFRSTSRSPDDFGPAQLWRQADVKTCFVNISFGFLERIENAGRIMSGDRRVLKINGSTYTPARTD